MRWLSAHSRRKLEIAWWKASSGGASGPDDVVVDVPLHGRLGDRVAHGRLAPVAPADQEGALRVGVQAPRVGVERRAGAAGQHRRREDERDGRSLLGKLLEARQRLRGGREADDVVVPRVALEQLALDLAQALGVSVDGKEHGPVHGCGCYSAAGETSALSGGAGAAGAGELGLELVEGGAEDA